MFSRLQGKQDPFVKVRYGGRDAKTSVVDGGGTDCAWEDEVLSMAAHPATVGGADRDGDGGDEGAGEPLVLEVWNDNSLRDTLIGVGEVASLAELSYALGEAKAFEVELARPGKKAKGTLTFEVGRARSIDSTRLRLLARAPRAAAAAAAVLAVVVSLQSHLAVMGIHLYCR